MWGPDWERAHGCWNGGGGLGENEGSVEARVSGALFTRVSKSCVSGKMVMRGG